MDTLSVNDRLIRSFVECQVERLSALGEAPGRVLDIGCGEGPYRRSVAPLAEFYLGLDVAPKHPGIGLVANAEELPLKDRDWGLILATEVIEHVECPEAFLSECARILAEDGRLLLTWPFVHPLHEVPYDFRRLSEFGAAKLFLAHDLTIELFCRRGNLLLTLWSLLSSVMRALLVAGGQRLGWIPGLRHLVGAMAFLLAGADRSAVALCMLTKPRIEKPGDALRGLTGILESLPLGYCVVLRRPVASE